MPTVALVDGNSTSINVEALPFNKGQGVQRVLLVFPSFQQLSYDPTSAFATADSAVDEALTTTLTSGAASLLPAAAAVLGAVLGAAALL